MLSETVRTVTLRDFHMRVRHEELFFRGHHENFHFSSKFNELWVRDLQMNANTMQRTTESDLTLNAYSRIVLEGPELESPQITISLYEVPNESPNLAPKCYPTNLLFLTLVAFSYISYRRKITL